VYLMSMVLHRLLQNKIVLCSYALAYIDIGVVHAFAAQTNVKKNKKTKTLESPADICWRSTLRWQTGLSSPASRPFNPWFLIRF